MSAQMVPNERGGRGPRTSTAILVISVLAILYSALGCLVSAYCFSLAAEIMVSAVSLGGIPAALLATIVLVLTGLGFTAAAVFGILSASWLLAWKKKGALVECSLFAIGAVLCLFLVLMLPSSAEGHWIGIVGLPVSAAMSAIAGALWRHLRTREQCQPT